MDELIDVLDSEGKLTGETIMKTVAHEKGIFHQTVHIWFYTQKGEILLQQRGKNKKTFPLLWDVSVAGHIGAGESVETSALREIEEEIGLLISKKQLEKIGIFKSLQKHSNTLIDNEFHHTFLVELNIPLTQLKKQKSEVEALKLTPLSNFTKLIQPNNFSNKLVPHNQQYYSKIILAIKNKL